MHQRTPLDSNLYFYASMNGVLEAVEKDFKAIEQGLLSTKDWCVADRPYVTVLLLL